MSARLFYLSGWGYICPNRYALMNLEQLKVGIRDIVAIGSLIVTIMVNYYSLRSEIRDVATTVSGDRKLYELRIQLIEANVGKLQSEIERLKYDNLDRNNANQTNPSRPRR